MEWISIKDNHPNYGEKVLWTDGDYILYSRNECIIEEFGCDHLESKQHRYWMRIELPKKD